MNETAERLGGVLNAYTSHDLVAFHITVRAESTLPAIDLLTDFVGRPKLDQDELDRERGVVIQEIQRYKDQPAAVAEQLIDLAGVRRAPARPPGARARGAPADVLARRDRRVPASGAGPARAAARSSSATSSTCRRTARSAELFERFPTLPEPEPYEPAPALQTERLVEERDTNQSHLRMLYRPKIDVSDRRQRAALTIYATLLGGSMGSRLFDEIREQRGLAYSVWAVDHAFATRPPSGSAPAWRRTSAWRRTRGCARSSPSCATTARREAEVERARAYAAGRRVLAFENTNAVARYRGVPVDRVRRGHRPRRRRSRRSTR